MRLRFPVFATLITGTLVCWMVVLHAQQSAGGAAAAGQPVSVIVVTADQETVAMFHRVALYPAKLTPLLEQVRPKDWLAKGAPETYVTQLASAQQQLQGIETDMTTIAQHPERMQEAMRGLFRVESFHRSLDSLLGGLRKYQNPALADLIQSVAAADQEDLGKLQEYILELANQKEQEYLVVDHEAQRCRAVISREPTAVKKPK